MSKLANSLRSAATILQPKKKTKRKHKTQETKTKAEKAGQWKNKTT